MKPLMRVFFFAVIQILVVTFNLQAQGWQQYWGASEFDCLSAVNDSVCWFGGYPTRVILATVHSPNDYHLSGRTPPQIDPSDGVMAICARGASLAWIGTTSGSLYRTTNGGTEWVKQFTQKDSAFIDGIYFWADSIGIAFGDPVTYPGAGPFIILRTTDGGTTWNDISSSTPSVTAQFGLCEDFDAVGSHFWFPSLGGASRATPRYLFHSRDRGLTWEKLTVPSNFADFCVAFSDTSNGLITNGYSQTARTTDGGKTWSVASNGVGWSRLKGQKGTNNFWVGGDWDAQSKTYPMYYSSDFGSTWVKQATNLPMFTLGISVSSGNVVWACTFNYLVLRNSTANTATSVATIGGELSVPPSFELQQNYPNPFNPSTTIKYFVRQEGATKIKVFDGVGREVRTLVNSNQSKGWHMIFWDGTNDHHHSVATGTYFYRIENNGRSEAKKMLLLR